MNIVKYRCIQSVLFVCTKGDASDDEHAAPALGQGVPEPGPAPHVGVPRSRAARARAPPRAALHQPALDSIYNFYCDYIVNGNSEN